MEILCWLINAIVVPVEIKSSRSSSSRVEEGSGKDRPSSTKKRRERLSETGSIIINSYSSSDIVRGKRVRRIIKIVVDVDKQRWKDEQ
jgi:hypothetical protein